MLKVSGATLFRDKLKERELLPARTAAKTFPISDLQLVPICGNGGPWIAGKDLLMRAKRVGADLGQGQVEYMLEHRDEFPETWKLFSLDFPEAVRRGRSSSLCYPFFYWNGEWNWDFVLLDARHPASGRLVLPRRG